MKKWSLGVNKGVTKAILIFLSIEVIAPLIIIYIKKLEKCFDSNYGLKNTDNLFNGPGIILSNPIVLIIYLVILLITFLAIYNIRNTVKNDKVENEGINYKEK